MSKFEGLAHIGLYTYDIEKSKSFYIENLDFKLDYEIKIDQPDNHWLKIAFISLNGMIIELLEPSDKNGIKDRSQGVTDHIAIKVAGLQDIVHNLKQKGIVFETEEPARVDSLFNGVQIIFFKGPSGERLELFEFLA